MKTDRITRALALATAAFVSAPGAVQADSHLRRRVPGVRAWEMYLGGNASRVESNSNFGIGTVDFGGGREIFGASTGNWINRGGFDIGVEIDLDKPGHLSDHFGEETDGKFRFGVSYSSGSERNSGSATPTIGGVDRVGLTFLEDTGGVAGTGIVSPFDVDRLDATVKIDNSWGLVNFGYSESFTPNGRDGVKVSVGGAFIYEWFDQEFSGRADIIRGGSSLAGQETRGDTEDKYYGYEFNAGVDFALTPKFSIGFQGYVTPSYHTGDASIVQNSDFVAGGLTQELRLSDDGFEVSGGLRASIEYKFNDQTSFYLSGEYSVLGGVSEVNTPANPGEQSASIDSGKVSRAFLRAFFTRELSDIRLKRDIVALARLDNGLKLYRYRYLWSDTLYVGVMAQEVAELMPDAVVRGADGFLRVYYARLGLALQTWDEWVAAREKTSDLRAIKVGAIHQAAA